MYNDEQMDIEAMHALPVTDTSYDEQVENQYKHLKQVRKSRTQRDLDTGRNTKKKKMWEMMKLMSEILM